MPKFRICIALMASLALMYGIPAGAVGPQEGEQPIEYAARVPLAAQSLLLDIVRLDGRLVGAGERGHIVLSDDDGETWRQAQSVPTRATFTSLAAVNGRLWAAGHDSVIVSSADGGETWELQHSDPERLQPIMDVHFSSPDDGIAIGAYGLVLVTSDGGQNWEDGLVDEENDYHLNALLVLPDNSWLIAGEAGYSYRSEDQGNTWQPLDLPYRGSMFGAVLTDEGCVLYYGLRGHVQSSCDGGETWQSLQTGINATLAGAATQDGLTLLAGNSGTLLLYQQGVFTSRQHTSGVDFSSVVGLGSGRFLLGGEEGTHFYPEEAGQTAIAGDGQ